MNYLLLSTGLLFISCSSADVEAPSSWVAFLVDGQVTIELPRRPLEMPASALATFISDNPLAGKTKAFKLDDQTGTYLIVTVPMNPRLELQLPRTIKPADRAPYYKSTVRIFLNSEGKLLNQALKTVDNVDFLTVKYLAPSPWLRTLEVKYVKTFMLTRTHTLYQLYFTPKDEADTTYAAHCFRFFQSVAIKKGH